MLATLMKAIVLMEVLPGKNIATPDGANLGVAADIELDLIRDKIWIIVKHEGQWSRIPSKQISSITDKVTLLEDWLPAQPDVI